MVWVIGLAAAAGGFMLGFVCAGGLARREVEHWQHEAWIARRREYMRDHPSMQTWDKARHK